MKTARVVLAFAALAVVALAVSGCVSSSQPLSDEELWGRFVGTWVNEKYAGLYEPQKTVIKPGFVCEDWLYAKDATRDAEWKATFKKGWVDAKGNTYCQFYRRYTEKYPSTSLMLTKVNRSGKVLEMVTRTGQEDGEYPSVIDPKARSDFGDWYYVYYRR